MPFVVVLPYLCITDILVFLLSTCNAGLYLWLFSCLLLQHWYYLTFWQFDLFCGTPSVYVILSTFVTLLPSSFVKVFLSTLVTVLLSTFVPVFLSSFCQVFLSTLVTLFLSPFVTVLPTFLCQFVCDSLFARSHSQVSSWLPHTLLHSPKVCPIPTAVSPALVQQNR